MCRLNGLKLDIALVPAKAGTQEQRTPPFVPAALDSRLRGNERRMRPADRLQLNVASMRNLMMATAAALMLGGLTDAVQAQPAECRVGKTQQVAELMFGRKIGDRIGVSETQWAGFVDREITPRFPDGLTVLNAAGQWRDPDRKRIVREPSKLVQIVLPGNADDFDKLGAIAQAYKQRFRQQSVGTIVRAACVAF
jgi:hypothetical protein